MLARKLKSIPAALCLASAGLVVIPTSALAQVTVTDRDSNAYLKDIEEHTKAIKEQTEELKQKLKDFKKFNDEQTTNHYAGEIERLNKMIEFVSHYKSADSGSDGKPGEISRVEADDRNHAHFDTFEDDNEDRLTNRTDVSNASQGESDKFAITIGSGQTGGGDTGQNKTSGGQSQELSNYLDAYDLRKPDDIFEDPKKRIHIEKLHSALYLAEVTAGETNAGREGRLEIYAELAEEAKKSDDLKTSMEINNAILLENGRNLAMLINLQTAQLNADSAGLRQSAQQKQAKSELFGSNALGVAALSGILLATQ